MTSYICLSWKHDCSTFRISWMPVGFCVLRSPKCVIVFDKRYVPLNRSCLRIHWENTSLPVGWCSVHSCAWQFCDAKHKVAHPVKVKAWRKYVPFTSANTCNRPPDTKVPDLVIKKPAGRSDALSQTCCTEVSWDLQPFSNRGPTLAIFG